MAGTPTLSRRQREILEVICACGETTILGIRQRLRQRAVIGALAVALVACVPFAMVRAGAVPREAAEKIEETDAAESPLWGEAVDGLQAGLAISRSPDSSGFRKAVGLEQSASRLECMGGEEIGVAVVVRNVSDKPISFTKIGGKFPAGTATGPTGKVQQLDGFKHEGDAFSDAYFLPPGKQVEFRAVGFQIATEDYKWYTYRGSAKFVAERDIEYQVSYQFSNENLPGERPAGEWFGKLETGKITVTLPELKKDGEGEKRPQIIVKAGGLQASAPPQPDERTIIWGQASDGFRAGILQESEKVQSVELGEGLGAAIVLRNVSGEEQVLRWRQNVARRGSWTVFDNDESFGAHDSWRRSWELRNKDDLIRIPPGHEIVHHTRPFAVIGKDNTGWVTPSARAGTGDFEAGYAIGLRFEDEKKQGYVETGKMKLKILPRTPHRLTGTRAENFQLAMADGSTFELAQSLGDEVVVLYFWGNGSYRTHEGAHAISRVAKKMKGKPVRLIGVNCDDTLEVSQAWMREKNVLFELALDRNKAVNHLFESREPPFPRIVIIGKNGVVKEVLEYFWPASKLEKYLEGMLWVGEATRR